MTLSSGTRIGAFKIAGRASSLIWTVAAVAALLSCAQARAFDGERKGFFLGIGVGGGIWSLDDNHSNSFSDLPTSGLATDFELGGCKDGRVMAYYSNRVVWLSRDTSVGVTGVGIRHWFTPESPRSAFWDMTLGLSSWRGTFAGTLGLGASLGLGIELRRHWLVRANALYGNAEPRVAAGTLVLQYLAY